MVNITKLAGKTEKISQPASITLLCNMSVFDIKAKRDQSKNRIFFDDPVTVARYDRHKYAWLDKLTEKQHGFFWRPQEVDVGRDAKIGRAHV